MDILDAGLIDVSCFVDAESGQHIAQAKLIEVLFQRVVKFPPIDQVEHDSIRQAKYKTCD
jgi:hypothetical protein